MSNSIEKFEVEERVRIMLLRHRGSTVKVIHDYQDEYGITLTPEYVEKIYRKLKREVQRDEIKWVGYHFAQEILSQSHQIQQILLDQYKSCEGQDLTMVSSCCHSGFIVDPISPVIPKNDSKNEVKDHSEVPQPETLQPEILQPVAQPPIVYRCGTCKRVCEIVQKVVLRGDIEHLKLSIVDRMRKENEFYLDFLKELGFVGAKKEEDQNPQIQAGKYVSIQQGNLPKRLVQAPAKVQENSNVDQTKVENLDPREQQLLIDKFVDVEFESDDKSGSNQPKQN
jgi:hypothetical protein